MSEEAVQEIDVVILWVDGNDPVLSEKRKRFLELSSAPDKHVGALPAFYASSNEIKYCVMSILTFAPFVRNIYIITDGQDPKLQGDLETHFPDRADSVKIVDHKEIFRGYEVYLPSFNSTSIQTLLWRIKGLSEFFIYFNDDMYLTRPSEPGDWFNGNRPVIRGQWRIPPCKKILSDFFKVLINKRIKGDMNYQPRLSFYLRQWNTARLIGFRSRYFFHDHNPQPMNRVSLENYFEGKEDLIRTNIEHRFRHRTQFVIASLAHHIELKAGNRDLADLGLTYIHPYYSNQRLHKKLALAKSSEKKDHICVQSFERLDREIQDEITDWMDEILNLNDPKHDQRG